MPGEPLFRVRGLVKHFQGASRALGARRSVVRAVAGVDLDVYRGETLGLVGESGCGKSTTGRAILRLVEPTAGSVEYDGEDVLAMGRDELRAFRRRAQIVFQDPFGSLNPRLSVGKALEEVLTVHGLAGSSEGRRNRVVELLRRVGLEAVHADRYPHEFSGGQRQRVGIARALAVEPEFIVCDEPVSALDVSVRAQVVNLLEDLQEELGLTYLFIAHDLGLIEHLCDRVAVMYLGRIVEVGPAGAVYGSPGHPYTRALLSAVPRPDPTRARARRSLLQGDVSGAAGAGEGCPFHPRCPHPERDGACLDGVPPLVEIGAGHHAACIKSG